MNNPKAEAKAKSKTKRNERMLPKCRVLGLSHKRSVKQAGGAELGEGVRRSTLRRRYPATSADI